MSSVRGRPNSLTTVSLPAERDKNQGILLLVSCIQTWYLISSLVQCNTELSQGSANISMAFSPLKFHIVCWLQLQTQQYRSTCFLTPHSWTYYSIHCCYINKRGVATAHVQFQAVQDYFLPHRVQTGSGAHPATYPTSTVGSFPRRQNGQGVKLTAYLHAVPRS
jgi:hypothetical protein